MRAQFVHARIRDTPHADVRELECIPHRGDVVRLDASLPAGGEGDFIVRDVLWDYGGEAGATALVLLWTGRERRQEQRAEAMRQARGYVD